MMRAISQLADLFLGDDALDFFGRALDPVARPSVRLDRQPGDDGVDVALLRHVAALRPLKMEQHVVIDCVVVGHGFAQVLGFSRSMRSSVNSGGPSVSLRMRRSRSSVGSAGSSNWPICLTARFSISVGSRLM